MNDVRHLKSYVWDQKTGDCFFVSTILRESSVPIFPPKMYFETIVWEYDWDNSQTGKMLLIEGEGGAFSQHFNICKNLYENGVSE